MVAVLALSAPAPQEAGGSVVVVLRAVSRAPPANLPSPSRDGCPSLARVRNGGREPWPFEVQWVTVPGQVVPNAFTVGLGSDGAFNIYALTNPHFIADLAGYFAP